MKKKFYIYETPEFSIEGLSDELRNYLSGLNAPGNYYITDLYLQYYKFGLVSEGVDLGESIPFSIQSMDITGVYNKLGFIYIDPEIETTGEKVMLILPGPRKYEVTGILGDARYEEETVLEVKLEIDDLDVTRILDNTDELIVVSKSPIFTRILNQRLKQLPYKFDNYARI